MKKLTALEIGRITKPGRYAVGFGAYLQITGKRGRSWVFRYERDGRARHVGLGPVALVSLAEARAKALDYRKQLLDGGDPLTAKQQARHARLLAAVTARTFRQCADGYISAHEAGWRSAQSHTQWVSSLAASVHPIIGELPVAAIDTGTVLRVLEPIWTTKPETASRIRGRIERVLDWAKARGYRNGENPARWKGHLDHLLPARSKLQRVEHFASLPYTEIGTLVAKLRQQPGTAARALEFLILVAARATEVRLARWAEVEGDVWVVPAARTKSGRMHRVPLADRAVKLLAALPRRGEYIFASEQGGAPVGVNSLTRLLARLGHASATVHGFRASFKTWASERTNYPREVVEKALAHSASDLESAYQRGDLLEKRARLMRDWALFCAKPSQAGDVATLRHAP
jgi:integrase